MAAADTSGRRVLWLPRAHTAACRICPPYANHSTAPLPAGVRQWPGRALALLTPSAACGAVVVVCVLAVDTKRRRALWLIRALAAAFRVCCQCTNHNRGALARRCAAVAGGSTRPLRAGRGLWRCACDLYIDSTDGRAACVVALRSPRRCPPSVLSMRKSQAQRPGPPARGSGVHGVPLRGYRLSPPQGGSPP